MNDLSVLLGMYAIDIALIYWLSKFGWKAVGFSVVTNMLLVFTLGHWEIRPLGLQTNLGTVFYAAVFFGTSTMCTKYSFMKAMRMPFVVFICTVFYLLAISSIRLLSIIPGNESAAATLLQITAHSGQLVVASFLSFWLSMMTNIALVQTGHKVLGNIIGQLVDSIVFFPIAFVGLLPGDKIALYLASGFLFKVLLNLLDTPVYYILHRGQKIPAKV